MVAGFLNFKQNQGNDSVVNLLSAVATNTIKHLFTQCKSVEVNINCYPSNKLLQGKIDSLKMTGQGLVIRKDFRTEEMWFETDAISIDFGSVLQGKLTLKQPTQAIAFVKLTEADINNAFKASLVRKRLENLSLPALAEISQGNPVSFSDVELELLPENRIKLFANAHFDNTKVPLGLSCTLAIAKRRQVRFENIEFESETIPEESRELSQKLTKILGEILNEMVDLDRFNLDGVTMRLNRLETQEKNLIFSGYAQIERFPNNG